MNPQLFKSTEFYHRRYHNMSTVLITPLILLVIFLFLFRFFLLRRKLQSRLEEV